MNLVLDILITAFLVLMNGFFVAAEFAIVKVRDSSLEIKSEAGNRFAKLTKNIVSSLDSYLAATQLGITLASLGLGWIGEPVVSKLIIAGMDLLNIRVSADLAHNIALPVAFAFITALHIIFGELMPKSIAIQRSESTALAVAYPLKFFYFIFRPFIWVLNGIANAILKMLGISAIHGAEVHSSEELKYLVKKGKESGTIKESYYNIIKNALDFPERTVRQVMIPRINVVAIDLNDYDETFLDKVINEGYSRIPVYEDSFDNVAGIVYIKDILLKMRKGDKISIREIMRPVIIAPESKRLGALLKEFQYKHQQMAVVSDEYGGNIGIVTMEDLLEELVGEIQDEYDAETPVVQKVSDTAFNINAGASLDDINEFLLRPIKKGTAYETLAGKLIQNFGRIPDTNDKIIFDDYEFTVLKKIKSAIILVQLRDILPPGNE